MYCHRVTTQLQLINISYLLLMIVHFETYRSSSRKVTMDTKKNKQYFHEHYLIVAALPLCSLNLVSVHIYYWRGNVGCLWCAWRWVSHSQSILLWSNIRTVKWKERFKVELLRQINRIRIYGWNWLWLRNLTLKDGTWNRDCPIRGCWLWNFPLF
jgi:hypothetical protein